MAPPPSDAFTADPETLAKQIRNANSHWEISEATGLALIDILEKSANLSHSLAGIRDALDSVICSPSGAGASAASRGTDPSPDGSGRGHLDSSVRLDALSPELWGFIDNRLSKTARALFGLLPFLDNRIDRFGVALDRSIHDGAEEICKLRPDMMRIDERLGDVIGQMREMTAVLREGLTCLCDCARADRQDALIGIAEAVEAESLSDVSDELAGDATLLQAFREDEPGPAAGTAESDGWEEPNDVDTKPQTVPAQEVVPSHPRGNPAQHHTR